MTSTDTNSRTQTEVLLDLINLEKGETIRFTAGRQPIVVTRQCGLNIEGVRKTLHGDKVAARMIAALVRG